MAAALECLLAISAMTGEMRQAVKDEDWTTFAELGEHCGRYTANLAPSEDQNPLAEADRRLKIDLIRQILADDAEIRDKICPWSGKLDRIFNGARH
jgi:flagellar protein FliT